MRVILAFRLFTHFVKKWSDLWRIDTCQLIMCGVVSLNAGGVMGIRDALFGKSGYAFQNVF